MRGEGIWVYDRGVKFRCGFTPGVFFFFFFGDRHDDDDDDDEINRR